MNLNQKPVAKFALIEVQITQTTNPIYKLPDDDILRNKRVVGICTYRRNSSAGNSPLNRPLPTDAAIWEGYLNLQCDNANVLQLVPLQQIALSPEQREMFPVDLVGISPTKSEVIFPDGGELTAGQSILLGISYVDQ